MSFFLLDYSYYFGFALPAYRMRISKLFGFTAKLSLSMVTPYLHDFENSSSPSRFYTQGDSSDRHKQIGISSQIINLRYICLITERNPYLADFIDKRVLIPVFNLVQTKKLCITLRVRQPRPTPDTEVSVRLRPLKRTQAPLTFLRGNECCRRRQI